MRVQKIKGQEISKIKKNKKRKKGNKYLVQRVDHYTKKTEAEKKINK